MAENISIHGEKVVNAGHIDKVVIEAATAPLTPLHQLPPGPAAFAIVPGLANGPPSYAARVIDESGAQEIYAIPGVAKVDAQGLPVFDSDWGVTLAVRSPSAIWPATPAMAV